MATEHTLPELAGGQPTLPRRHPDLLLDVPSGGLSKSPSLVNRSFHVGIAGQERGRLKRILPLPEPPSPCGAFGEQGFTNTPTVSGRDRRGQMLLIGPAQFFRLRKL